MLSEFVLHFLKTSCFKYFFNLKRHAIIKMQQELKLPLQNSLISFQLLLLLPQNNLHKIKRFQITLEHCNYPGGDIRWNVVFN